MNPITAGDRPARTVNYFAPFTHYVAADALRMLILAGGVALAASIVLLAWRRWNENRVSASLFLIALTLSHLTFGLAGVVALGRPPVWPYLIMESVVLAVSAVACYVVVGEAKRGVWARRA